MTDQAIVDKFAEYVGSLSKEEGMAVVHQVVTAHLERHSGTVFCSSGATEFGRFDSLAKCVLDTVGRSQDGSATMAFCVAMALALSYEAIELLNLNKGAYPNLDADLAQLEIAQKALASVGPSKGGVIPYNQEDGV